MKHIITCLILFVISSFSYGQTKISGVIKDSDDQPLPRANVYLKDTYDGVS
ncbi:MAG: carboxypeptidase regulatory-like domain-containing protein, partial [Ignavibacteria bacterium]|nr:carboxypeptidase regulatory-like domain-containing protein [Ignavibacteria bacterium]